MKNKIRILLFFLLTSTGLYAENSTFTSSVALVGMSMDYREYSDNSQILDSEKSDFTDLTGAEMSLGYFFDKEVSAYSQVTVNLMFLSGETEYVGSLLNSGLGYGSYIGTTANTIIDTDISFKRTNILSKDIDLHYGIGLGYRSWRRALSVSQVEIYKWFSLRPAAGVKYNIDDNLNIGISLEYQYGINPKMSESTSDYDFSLASANIFEVSLPINYKYSEDIDIFVEGTFQQQTIEKSNSIDQVINGNTYTIWEPDSTANNQYLKLGLVFKF